MFALLAAIALAATPKPTSASAASPASDRVKPSASFPVEYAPPTDKTHIWIYEAAQEQQALEGLSRILGVVRMPRPVKLRLSSCDGVSNAWYDDTNHTVTFCYEFVAEMARNAPEAAKSGIALDEAVLGPFTFFYLHEIGHALIDVLKLPVLGREEDAADRFATFVLISAGPEFAVPAIRGTAWTFKHDASARKVDESDFADVHGLDAQRFYDVVCIAYGSNPEKYTQVPQNTGLPLERAEECSGEWQQVRYGYVKVLGKYLDRNRFKQARDAQLTHMKARREKARRTGAVPGTPVQPAP